MRKLADAGSKKSVTIDAVVTVVLVVLAVCCGSERAPIEETTSGQGGREKIIVAAGDIASCATSGDEATARLLAANAGTVAALGDNAYDSGSAEEYRRCYGPTWGRFKGRTRPVPGNHEYLSEGAEGYFDYFGEAAGDPAEGYYSYDLGTWHVVALNSDRCTTEIGGCNALSQQVRWLKVDLDANEAGLCTLAYMHHPRFSSGEEHGSTPEVKPLWEALYESGADVVLSAHEHNYERFIPQDPDGKADPEHGIREFVVGTGGKSHYKIETTLANSEVHNDETYGVLKLTLHRESYTWRFVPVENAKFTDSGHGRCH